MRLILKSLWTHRKQNGWIFAEIAIITALSWFMVDFLTVTLYSTHFCIPAGEFEKEHLCVGQFGVVKDGSEGDFVAAEENGGIHVVKHKLEALPEVSSVCLSNNYLGANLRLYSWRTLSLADDTMKTVGIATLFYHPNERFFETQGLRAIEGSPDAETLSRAGRQDGVIITRSVAQNLFGTDQVVGKLVAMVDGHPVDKKREDWTYRVVGYHTITGVVEDVKSAPNERYPYMAFFPTFSQPSPACQVMIRLKPEADAEAFVKKLAPTLTTDYRAGISVLAKLETYQQHYEAQLANDGITFLSQLATIPVVLFLINVVLGTLGTYWLQIRKRKEDIGIIRAFGASRRRIFGMLLGEGAILTALATLVGCFIFFQFTVLEDLLSNGEAYGGSGRESDWVTQFWPHFLIVSAIVYLLLLVVVCTAVSLPAWKICRMNPVEALRDE